MIIDVWFKRRVLAPWLRHATFYVGIANLGCLGFVVPRRIFCRVHFECGRHALPLESLAIPDATRTIRPVTHGFDALRERRLAISLVSVANFRVLASASIAPITRHRQFGVARPNLAGLAHRFMIIDVWLHWRVLAPWLRHATFNLGSGRTTCASPNDDG